MAGESQITINGNLSGDPELRFTPNGAAVANFTVAQTPRNKVGDKWEDGETQWFRVSVWRQYAENVAETLRKGDRVVVTGRLKMRKYTKDGVERLSIEVDADEVAVSLRYATAKVVKAVRGGPGGEGRQQGGGHGAPAAQAPAPDPWSVPAGTYTDAPPF